MIELEQICKYYGGNRTGVTALKNISIKIPDGEFLVIQGPSGSGKTTLLLTIGGMLHPSSGNVLIDKQDLYSLSHKNRARFRAKNIGFVFQLFHLLPYLTAEENILLPTALSDADFGQNDAADLMQRFGLSRRALHKPFELSVGERQRTAISRAMINKPKIILADEPTGNLDPENATEVFDYLKQFQRGNGTVILVTHGSMADTYADRLLRLREGRIEEK